MYRRTRRRTVTEIPLYASSGKTYSRDEIGAEAAKNGASLESVLLDQKRVTVSIDPSAGASGSREPGLKWC